MPALFVFLFKVNMALLLFCAGYYLVLRHLTFYSLNRVYLITAIVFASIYPKIDLTAFAQGHENITLPVQTVILNWQVPAIKPLAEPQYWQWITVMFWAGAALLGIRLFVQLFSLLKLHRKSVAANVLNHEVRLIDGQAAPFSFWRSIYVNPANYTPADLEAILLHEQVHVNGWHTVDILLAELSSIFYWFNPGVWLMKKAVRENIEFITDRKILNKGIDTKAYQYSLVNVSFNTTTPGIVNHFNISTIKKRIIMMNAKRSSKVNLTRYTFVVPAVALLLVFSFSNAAVVKKNSSKAYKIISATINDKLANVVPLVHNVTTSLKTTVGDNKPVADTVHGTINGTFKTDKMNIATINGKFNTTSENLQLLTDTTRKASFSINTKNMSLMDTMNYVVNGKKITIAEFNKIDPNTIVSVNIVTAETARTMLNDFDSMNFKPNSKILLITTGESDKGVQLHDVLVTNNKITRIRVNGKTTTLSGDVREVNVDTVVIRGNGKSKDNLVYAPGNNLTFKKLDSGAQTLIYGSPDKLKLVSGVQVFAGKRSTDLANPRELTRTAFNVTSVNRISDKLIIIDGKEASEAALKKLSAFDIDRMSTASDAETIKKYGDKAKYGVVYIYTKKGK